ncbi:uncharacterized protein PAC_12844 [Phialocephala subalpina]|uniref:Uncharacterized protein n=1 Tax=Phialocephala subalpina TaxID=576137 RepID=A0A1L7XDA6_9HELO|nr:uncharacterized protein PAC_12844 [Phialocephala subalpina]
MAEKIPMRLEERCTLVEKITTSDESVASNAPQAPDGHALCPPLPGSFSATGDLGYEQRESGKVDDTGTDREQQLSLVQPPEEKPLRFGDFEGSGPNRRRCVPMKRPAEQPLRIGDWEGTGSKRRRYVPMATPSAQWPGMLPTPNTSFSSVDGEEEDLPTVSNPEGDGLSTAVAVNLAVVPTFSSSAATYWLMTYQKPPQIQHRQKQ